MLTIFDSNQRFNRRSFLKVGSLALGGLSLPGLLAAKASAAEAKRLGYDKSVIFLFLHGGPRQIETFHPKMTAADSVRSATGQAAAKLPRVPVGDSRPQRAARADKGDATRTALPHL